MASNLLNTGYGADALREAVCDQIRRRMRRWFKRNTVIAFDDWVEAAKAVNFDFATVLGNLNVVYDQEIYDLYQLLKELELGFGTVNADFYVNTVVGDDVEGDGSVDAPFATMTRVLNLLPKFVNSPINIFLVAPTANPITAMPDIDIEFGPGGQITIQGASNPNVIAAPLTLTGWTDVGVGDTYAHQLTVAGAGWAPNMYRGYFVNVTSGASAGAYYAIASNTADTLVIPVTANPMAPADTFSILEPGDYINMDFQRWRVALRANTLSGSSRFIMSNIRFRSLMTEFCGTESLECWFAFCYFFNLLISGSHVSINRWDPYDISQIGAIEFREQNPFTYTEYAENWANECDMYKGVIEQMENQAGHVELKNVIWQNYKSRNSSSNKIDNCYCYSSTADPVELFDFSSLVLDGLWVEESAFNAINIYRGTMYAVNLEGVTANIPGYTVLVGPISSFQFNGVLVSGTTNDVYWQLTGVAAAWPGVAGTGITDGVGAWVAKIS